MSTSRRSRGLSAIVTGIVVGALATPLSALPAAAAGVNEPPVAPHSIFVFPMRDFVSSLGYAPGDRPTVQIVRGGVVVGTAADLVPQDDPKTAGFDGLVHHLDELHRPVGPRCALMRASMAAIPRSRRGLIAEPSPRLV